MELAKRKIIEGVHNVICPLLFLGEEDVVDLLGSCYFYNLIWNNICMWFGIGVSSLVGSLLDML